MSGNEANIRHLLEGLGRATHRGVKKCPKCETINGNSRLKCKNKSCEYVLRYNETKVCKSGHRMRTKKKTNSSVDHKLVANGLESIRVITSNSSSNVYSVRVRDRGPDYRGFVEVPIIRGLDGTSDPSLNASFIAETTARCFIDVCGSHKVVLPISPTPDPSNHSSSNASNIRLKLIESCLHIKDAVKSSTDAKPLALKNSVLNQLPISDHMRQQIAELAFDTPGPLVQRVSKTSLVVKCKANSKQPLGYLHCYFGQLADRNSHCLHNRFSCVCKAFKTFKCVDIQSNSFSDKVNEGIIDHKTYELSAERKCVHYWASICAFASDEIIGHELMSFIIKELPQFVWPQEIHCSDTSGQKDEETDESKKRLRSDDNRSCEVINTRKLIDRGIISESDVSLNFIEWLSSVTELINQTMHYQLNGKPEPLVFTIPQVYFDCFQQRIAMGLRKKRLPNITTVFTRKDRPPLGTFTKYTYLITNIIHVKHIFDTTKQCLHLHQSFVRNRDGSYDYLYSKASNDLCDSFADSSGSDQLIKPSELKTFLKVGLMSANDPKESAIPFVIEWIPDILPNSHFGELRVELQFGHIRNGRVENNDNKSV